MTRPTLSQLGDDWYTSEESTRAGIITEMQRMRRRFAARPGPVLLLAALITAALGYKIYKKQPLVSAEVVLALSEGQLGKGHAGIPADELQKYVANVLLPDKPLLELIEKKDLYSLRKKLGNQFALEQLRDQMEIDIWKNSFLYYDEHDYQARKSARIGITIVDKDPDKAADLARELAKIAIAQHELERKRIARAVESEIKEMRAAIEQQLGKIANQLAIAQTAMAKARQEGKNGVASALLVDIMTLDSQMKNAEKQLSSIATSQDNVAVGVAAAGLDLTLAVVEERIPPHPEKSPFVLVIVLVVIGTGAFLGAALFVGAFDSRIHDTDDVERLGLPVLGHVPGFAGDSVGSLDARGARRARVGSVMRWRSYR